jgi:hypothetical protein
MTDDFGDKTDAYLYADASAAIGVANREGLGRIRHLDTQSLWLQQALRKRRLGLGKVLGTENPSDLMTKHVDSKLLGEHVRCMGCEFVGGRAELAPQVIQCAEDVIDLVEDMSSGLMTTSTNEQLAAPENHCATGTEVCLPQESCGHRLADFDCRGGDENTERSPNRRWDDNNVDRECNRRASVGEHLSGHPHLSFLLPFGHSRPRGAACFSAICSHRLSVHVNEHLHLCTCDVHRLIFSP